MLVHDFLQISAQRFPEKEALICSGKRFTYDQLETRANRLANALISRGIKKGDRVAVHLVNCAEAVVAIYAILKSGAVFFVIHRTTKIQKLSFILNNCLAKAMITDSRAYAVLSKHHLEIPSLEFVVLCDESSQQEQMPPFVLLREIVESFPATPPEVRCIDMDLAALIYTSGSTGQPKGVMMTHLNIVSAVNSITHYLENVSSDILINVLPLSFDYGLYQVLMTFKFGGTLVLEQSFLYPFAVIDLILKEKVTGFPIVPTIAAILLQLDSLSDYHFDHLRYISNTAAHLPTHHIRKLQHIFPSTRIYSMYGLTECKRVCYLPPDQLDRRPDSVGRAMPNEEVYIVDETGQRVGSGVIGELVVRGSNVMKGYWGMPEETNKVLRPGLYPWEHVLYTGDLFRMDEEGYLYFVARKDDIIKSRGEKVSPKEVENVIYNMPGVAEVAIVGIQDEILGESIKAFIVPENGSRLDVKEIKNHCHRCLEDFMIPQIIEIRSSLPKTESGKIRKTELR